jgi:hypothetical protein
MPAERAYVVPVHTWCRGGERQEGGKKGRERKEREREREGRKEIEAQGRQHKQ